MSPPYRYDSFIPFLLIALTYYQRRDFGIFMKVNLIITITSEFRNNYVSNQ